MTALRSGATEGTARSYAQAQQATHAAEAARGGSQLPSGVNAQIDAENANQAAAANAASQQQITLANAQQKHRTIGKPSAPFRVTPKAIRHSLSRAP